MPAKQASVVIHLNPKVPMLSRLAAVAVSLAVLAGGIRLFRTDPPSSPDAALPIESASPAPEAPTPERGKRFEGEAAAPAKPVAPEPEEPETPPLRPEDVLEFREGPDGSLRPIGPV